MLAQMKWISQEFYMAVAATMQNCRIIYLNWN